MLLPDVLKYHVCKSQKSVSYQADALQASVIKVNKPTLGRIKFLKLPTGPMRRIKEILHKWWLTKQSDHSQTYQVTG